ncbi:hypothetical protein F5Y17DRAFT_455599 [Xylariaceae sp. FL0594]|nr:hypothetical protein F5Y17DRAFT_455599 [Xylariaceae sp. FL0594]
MAEAALKLGFRISHREPDSQQASRKKDYDILADFEKLPPKTKEDVAHRLDEVNIHPTVLDHIKEWGEKLQIRVKVRLDALLPSLRQSSRSKPRQEYTVLEAPEGSRISTVFPTPIKDCVARTGTRARYYDITTEFSKFPDIGDGDCIMEVLVRADRIYWLTMALFASWAPEYRSGMRCVISPDGRTTIPERTITLTDVREDKIDGVLGGR